MVDAIGGDVTRLSVGDRVFGMPRFGGYTDTLARLAPRTQPQGMIGPSLPEVDEEMFVDAPKPVEFVDGKPDYDLAHFPH